MYNDYSASLLNFFRFVLYSYTMNAFTIKDLENLSGIKAHTIRIWEQRYSFLKPKRTQTNIRYYSNDELKLILNISLLNKYGYKVSHIDKMSNDEISQKVLTLSHTDAQQERVIYELITHMISVDSDKFELVLNNFILARGIEKTITQIVFPFLDRIGIFWLTSNINSAQEHLVTNIIRQKLIIGIEKKTGYVQVNKTVLLFLPEGEHHELGLLFIHYLLKSHGVKVIYLGTNIPMKDVEFVANLKKPDVIYAHLTSVASNFNLEKYLRQLTELIPDFTVVLSGQLIQHYNKVLPPKVSIKKSLQEVMEYISSL